jgi:trehalose 6-phosphate synthase
MVGDRKLILRTDRVEPSKNILRGLHAFRILLESHPEHAGKVIMLALLVPSRMEVNEYQTYLQEIMAEAGMINARFSDEYWEPVRIIVGDSYPRAIAAMEMYDVLLVNPITDGMNLVAKEGALVNGHDGVLLLSEHAGAFYELGEHAITISPFDVYGTANAMHMALTMPEGERRTRAEQLRKTVRAADVKHWFANQVADALAEPSSQSKKSSTPDTPDTSTSAESRTKSGVSSESTPTPRE